MSTSQSLRAFSVAALVTLAAMALAASAAAKPRPGGGDAPSKPAAGKRSRAPSKGVPKPLRPTPHAMFTGLQLGAAVGIEGSGSQFKLQPEFGWHLLSGNGTGLAIGLTTAINVGDDVFLWQLTPRVWWDFQPKSGLGLYIAPHVGLGVAAGGGGASFTWGFGAQARLAINQVVYAVMQPVAFDFFHGAVGTAVRYDFLLGFGGFF